MTHVRRNTVWSATVLLCLVALLLTPRLAFAAPKPPQPTLSLDLCDPAQHTFTADVSNPYFPLPIDRVWAYSGKEQGENIGLQITVLNETEMFNFGGGQTVTTRVVEEREWADTTADGVFDPLNEQLIEVSRNYFAQTEAGTVCYFGENVDIFENGGVSHEGAWRADGRKGLPGTAPGIFMPAEPQRGMTFQQEVAEGVAQDLATITNVGKTTITVRDFNPLDGSTGTKVYEQGTGLIQDGPLRLIRVTG
jgi:hypothetical protein